uniref:Uncharacterized protein n=1 Tax=Neolamprologus brichardi TaxID=32507 RepID=A0A3Q4MWH8_NEOBR
MYLYLTLGVCVVRHEGADSADTREDIGVIIEGCTVLQALSDVAKVCALLLELIYSLNLRYPKHLKYIFEFLQKVLMELDGNNLSLKVQVLKNKLLDPVCFLSCLIHLSLCSRNTWQCN